MRENDGAMDAIELTRKALEAFLAKPGPIAPFLLKCAIRAGEGASGKLGLAEEFHERGVDLRPARGVVEKAIEHELRPARLAEWDSPKTRRKTLLAFGRRIFRNPPRPARRRARPAGRGPVLETRHYRDGLAAFRAGHSPPGPPGGPYLPFMAALAPVQIPR